MKNSDAVRQLRAELAQDYEFIVLNGEKNRVMSAGGDRGGEGRVSLRRPGIYTAQLVQRVRRVFFTIAKFFENNIAEPTWHRGLLERMTLDIGGIRPALMDLAMSQRIEELLKFRHVFRNISKAPLVPAKVEFANQAAQGLAADYKDYHLRFMDF